MAFTVTVGEDTRRYSQLFPGRLFIVADENFPTLHRGMVFTKLSKSRAIYEGREHHISTRFSGGLRVRRVYVVHNPIIPDFSLVE